MIFAQIQAHLKKLRADKMEDLKTFYHLSWFLVNVSDGSPKAAKVIATKTCVVDCCVEAIQTCGTALSQEVADKIVKLMENLCQSSALTQHQLQCIGFIIDSVINVHLSSIESVAAVFSLIDKVANIYTSELHTVLSPDAIVYCVDHMDSTHQMLYDSSVRASLSLLLTDDPSTLELILSKGLIDKVFRVLLDTNLSLVKLALWGLSNIMMYEEVIISFFRHDQLTNRVILLMQNSNIELSGEAGFVITNALTNCSDQTLSDVRQCLGDQDLVHSLCICLKQAKAKRLVKSLLFCFERCLKAD